MARCVRIVLTWVLISAAVIFAAAAPSKKQLGAEAKLERRVKLLKSLVADLKRQKLENLQQTTRQNEVNNEVVEIDLIERLNETLCLMDYDICHEKFLDTNPKKVATVLRAIIDWVIDVVGADADERKCLVIAHVIEVSRHLIAEHGVDEFIHDMKALFLQVLIHETADKELIVSLVQKVPDIVHDIVGTFTLMFHYAEHTMDMMNTTTRQVHSEEESTTSLFKSFHVPGAHSPTVADLAGDVTEYIQMAYKYIKMQEVNGLECSKALNVVIDLYEVLAVMTLPRSVFSHILSSHIDFTGREVMLEKLLDGVMQKIDGARVMYEQLALLHQELMSQMNVKTSYKAHQKTVELLLEKELVGVRENVVIEYILEEIAMALPKGILDGQPEEVSEAHLVAALKIILNKIIDLVPIHYPDWSPLTQNMPEEEFPECQDLKLVAISQGLTEVVRLELANSEGYISKRVGEIVKNVTKDSLSRRSQDKLIHLVNLFLAKMTEITEKVQSGLEIDLSCELMPLDIVATILTQHDHGYEHEGTEQEEVKNLRELLRRIARASIGHWTRTKCGPQEVDVFEEYKNLMNALNESFVKTTFDPRLTSLIAEELMTHCKSDHEAQPCPSADQLEHDLTTILLSVVRFLQEEDPTTELMAAIRDNASLQEIRSLFKMGLAEGLGKVMYTTIQYQDHSRMDHMGSGEMGSGEPFKSEPEDLV